MKKEMSTNCLITLGSGGYQPIKFALSRPTSELRNLSHLLETRKLSVFSTELPGLCCILHSVTSLLSDDQGVFCQSTSYTSFLSSYNHQGHNPKTAHNCFNLAVYP
jgi:hypothetical protein